MTVFESPNGPYYTENHRLKAQLVCMTVLLVSTSVILSDMHCSEESKGLLCSQDEI